MVIISHTVAKPKIIFFFLCHKLLRKCSEKSYLQMIEFTITKVSLKSQRCTAQFGCYCLIVTIYSWISSASFQDLSFACLPPATSPGVSSGAALCHFSVVICRTNSNCSAFLSLELKGKKSCHLHKIQLKLNTFCMAKAETKWETLLFFQKPVSCKWYQVLSVTR